MQLPTEIVANGQISARPTLSGRRVRRLRRGSRERVQFIQRNLYIVNLSLMSERIALCSLPGILVKHLVLTGGTVAILRLMTLALVIAGAPGSTVDVVAVATFGCAVVYFQADFDRAVLVKRGTFAGAVLLFFDRARSFRACRDEVGQLPVLHGGARRRLSRQMARASRHRTRWRWGMRFIARDWRNYGVPTLLAAAANAPTPTCQ